MLLYYSCFLSLHQPLCTVATEVEAHVQCVTFTLLSLSLLLKGSSSSLYLVSLSTGVEVGKDQEFAIDTKGAGGQGKLDVTILSPSRKVVPCLVAPVAGKESSTAKFIPREEGLFAVDVTYDGHPVPGSPYTVEASLPPDPTKVSSVLPYCCQIWFGVLPGKDTGKSLWCMWALNDWQMFCNSVCLVPLTAEPSSHVSSVCKTLVRESFMYG